MNAQNIIRKFHYRFTSVYLFLCSQNSFAVHLNISVVGRLLAFSCAKRTHIHTQFSFFLPPSTWYILVQSIYQQTSFSCPPSERDDLAIFAKLLSMNSKWESSVRQIHNTLVCISTTIHRYNIQAVQHNYYGNVELPNRMHLMWLNI